MAICRVYLATYRRHETLPRAIESLLNQTFTDWVCELHNDDPFDPFPQQLVEEIGDPRLQVINHAENLGATRSFNLVFQPVPEEFVSLLEDDNWWEPDFLETMLNAMRQFPNVQVSWANMRHWQEEADGSWTNTGKTTWDVPPTNQPNLLEWGHPRQMLGALHSNGAMLVRSRSASWYRTPSHTPFEGAEAIRERTFHFPILFVPQVCANFAITRQSSRSNNAVVWAQLQTLLAGSFLKYVPLNAFELKQIWQDARSKTPKSSTTLFFAALSNPEVSHVLKYANFTDWLFCLSYCLKHPVAAWQIKRAIATYPALWQFLDEQTAARSRERRGQERAKVREIEQKRVKTEKPIPYLPIPAPR